ncbi:Uncharacterised protein [Escherichia coli]|nr:Uncharacterised protein [Escherichia coli]
MAINLDFKGKVGLSRMFLEEYLVPKAGLEPARISTVFACPASCSKLLNQLLRIRHSNNLHRKLPHVKALTK